MTVDDKKITPEQCKDSGLALVLITLICFQVWKQPILIPLAIAFLLVTMTYPPIFKPFAIFWFALSTALGTVVSRIILALLFYLLVFPIGLLRRAMGKDAMQIKDWKKSKNSVFHIRDHRFGAKDLEHPY
jgi:multisubunit Na+/H+ antiporter MnhG subunit